MQPIQNRRFVGKAIRLLFFVIALAVGWQAVRFCQGKIGAPVLDWAMAAMDRLLATDGLQKTTAGVSHWDGFFSALWAFFYYVTGFVMWLAFAPLVYFIGATIARTYEVGFKQCMTEIEDAQSRSDRQAQLEYYRARRWARRTGRTDEKGLSLGSMLIGAAVAWLLF
jgi:hypothetical protein